MIGAAAVRIKAMVRVGFGSCSRKICGGNERVVDILGCVVVVMMKCYSVLTSGRDLPPESSIELLS